eukprot:TRINITY_DN51613_c0_g1_i1.p1 TRINITY_DN51613_c0_g1~~TRINITY_DN51613_c0_g1_i1.p1  ORF type:complete len:269 (-),score=50.93 TRINITY_DN51613_c0_g1_i1:189-995(-)
MLKLKRLSKLAACIAFSLRPVAFTAARRESAALSDMTAESFDQVYEDIKRGGALRWKAGEKVKDWETQHENIRQFVDPQCRGDVPTLLVPLSGDCAYVKYAWDMGFHVTAVEWSSVAVGTLLEQFAASGVSFTTSQGTAGTDTTVYEGERIRLVVADWAAYTAHAEAKELASFDVIFDKDAFGFLGPTRGKPYAATLCKLLKPKAFVYLEVKNRAGGGSSGPPFHISVEDISDSFGSCSVPIVKDFGKQPAPYGPEMTQAAYMLQASE